MFSHNFKKIKIHALTDVFGIKSARITKFFNILVVYGS